jgi:hypothetical protein
MFSTATQNRKKESREISPVKCMSRLYLPAKEPAAPSRKRASREGRDTVYR